METITSLAIIMVIAVLAPLIVETSGALHPPVVVLEIALGIIAGPQLLNLAQSSQIIDFLSELGLAFLLFQAGFELRLDRLKGRTLRLALASWFISVGLALSLAGILHLTGLIGSFLIVGIAMSTSAIGIILPIVQDAGILQSSVGNLILAVGAIGEFGPILFSAIALEKSHSTTLSVLLLNAFLVVLIAGFLLMRYWQPAFVVRLVDQTMASTAQLGTRLSLLILVGLIYLANVFGLSILLGAFGAGLIVAQAVSHLNQTDRQLLGSKYQALGFGFLIPIFFIVSGLKFDLMALLQNGSNLLLVPLFFIFFVVVRATPIFLISGRQISRLEQLKVGLFSAVQLPVVVAITSLGVKAGELQPAVATAMVGAGMLSVFLLPLIALRLDRLFKKSSNSSIGIVLKNEGQG